MPVFVYLHGGDPERTHVSGHSAGGHLTAMLLVSDWEDAYGLPKDIIKGAINGLFDLLSSPTPFCSRSSG